MPASGTHKILSIPRADISMITVKRMRMRRCKSLTTIRIDQGQKEVRGNTHRLRPLVVIRGHLRMFGGRICKSCKTEVKLVRRINARCGGLLASENMEEVNEQEDEPIGSRQKGGGI